MGMGLGMGSGLEKGRGMGTGMGTGWARGLGSWAARVTGCCCCRRQAPRSRVALRTLEPALQRACCLGKCVVTFRAVVPAERQRTAGQFSRKVEHAY